MPKKSKGLEILPDEIILAVLEQLSAKDIMTCASVRLHLSLILSPLVSFSLLIDAVP